MWGWVLLLFGCGGPGGLAGGLGTGSSISSVLGLESLASSSLLGTVPRRADARGHGPLLMQWPGGGSPGPSQWLSPGEAGFFLGAFVELVLGSFGKYNECVPPLTLSEEQQDRKGTGQMATASSAWKLCLSREGTITQQDHTRAPFPGLLGATVKVDRQTDNAGPCSSPQQPGQDQRRGSGRSTMYTAVSRGGHRYLTRFSTEYTDM